MALWGLCICLQRLRVEVPDAVVYDLVEAFSSNLRLYNHEVPDWVGLPQVELVVHMIRCVAILAAPQTPIAAVEALKNIKDASPTSRRQKVVDDFLRAVETHKKVVPDSVRRY